MGTAASIATDTIRRPAPLALDAGGMTLCTFDRDAAGSGRSVCDGPCVTPWPPLAAGAQAADSGDRTGDRTGDGFGQ